MVQGKAGNAGADPKTEEAKTKLKPKKVKKAKSKSKSPRRKLKQTPDKSVDSDHSNQPSATGSPPRSVTKQSSKSVLSVSEAGSISLPSSPETKPKKKSSPLSKKRITKFKKEIKDLKKELKEEEKERNTSTQERDHIQVYWENAVAKVDKHNDQLWLAERKVEEVKEEHEHKSRYLEKKIKFLEIKHEEEAGGLVQEIASKKLELATVESNIAREKVTPKIMEPQKTATDQKVEETMKMINEIERKHKDEMSSMKEKYEHEIHILHEELVVRSRNDTKRFEQDKVEQFEEIRRLHEQKMNQIYLDYQKAIERAGSQNHDLQDQLVAAKERLEEKTELFQQTQEKYEKAVDEIQELLLKNREVEKELHQHQNLSTDHQYAVRRLKALEKEVTELMFEKEHLLSRVCEVEKERDDLYHKLVSAVSEVRDTAEIKKQVIDQKIKAAKEKLLLD